MTSIDELAPPVQVTDPGSASDAATRAPAELSAVRLRVRGLQQHADGKRCLQNLGFWASIGLADRWSFEALGRVVQIDRILGDGALPTAYRNALTGSPVSSWLALVALTVIGLVLATIVLERRTG